MKKILDMLFEPEEEVKTEVIVEAPLEDVRIREKQKTEVIPASKNTGEEKKVEKRSSRSFINLEELQQRKPKHVKKEEPEAPKRSYEFRRPLSPVFGYVGENDDKDMVLHTPQLADDTPSALGTIISPYYGPRENKPVQEKKQEVPSKSMLKDETKDLLPHDQEVQQETTITLTQARELPISSLLHKINPERAEAEKTDLQDMLNSGSDDAIADTEISLFDELFRSEGE